MEIEAFHVADDETLALITGDARIDPDDDARIIDEVVAWLERSDPDTHAVVRAAMAHLHVVSVHPFRDGNGRISRIVQSLVLAREGLLAPEFVSIEEYLGRNTRPYYETLLKVQSGRLHHVPGAARPHRAAAEA